MRIGCDSEVRGGRCAWGPDWIRGVCRGMPDDDSSLYHALHRLMDKAGVPHSGWHQLRHTAATLLAAAGTDVATIGRILGHRPGSVVTLRYLHTDDARLRQAAEAVAHAVRSA